MGSPIFFVQTRSGKNKKYFKIFKFRTMIADTANFKEADRLTSLGIFLENLVWTNFRNYLMLSKVI